MRQCSFCAKVLEGAKHDSSWRNFPSIVPGLGQFAACHLTLNVELIAGLFVGGAVHSAHPHSALELAGQVNPGGFEGLAMAAPGGIKLQGATVGLA